jgi:hypothetical protein
MVGERIDLHVITHIGLRTEGRKDGRTEGRKEGTDGREETGNLEEGRSGRKKGKE